MKALTFMGHAVPLDGYGEGVIHIGAEMKRLKRSVHLVDMRPDPEHKPGAFCRPEDRWDIEGTAVALCVPDWFPQIDADRLIGYTMFEASKLPPGWVRLINDCCEFVIVPSFWCASVFRTNGVKVPVTVVRWGIDPHELPLLRRRHEGRPYTFLWSGTPDMRKGWDVAYSAFIRAFGDRRDVRLVLHFREALPGKPTFGDRNVSVQVGKLSRACWLSALGEADAFVFPSRGEGWGLPPREAAATGLPVIATDYGGLHDGLCEWGLPVGVHGHSVAEYGFFDAGTIGSWPEPDVDQVAELMHRLVEQPQVGVEFGEQASRWLAAHATWERSARGVLRLAGDA